MKSVSVAFQVLPKVTGDSYAVVDKAIDVVIHSGVKHMVCPFETVMEGPMEQLMQIVEDAQQACLDAGASEVMTIVKIHNRPEGVTIVEKLEKYRDRQ